LAEREGIPEPEYAGYQRAYADVSVLLGEYDEAVRMLEEAAERARRTDDSAADVARVLSDLSIAYGDRGDLERAIEVMEESLALRKQALGPQHPDVARGLHNYSQILLKVERFDDAVQASRESIEILSAALHPDHADVAYTEVGLANLLLTREKYEEAAELYVHALSALRKTVGNDHPHIAVVQSSLGGAWVHTDREEEGLEMVRAAAEHAEKVWGSEHPQVVDFHLNYGVTLTEAGRLDEAATALEHSVQLARKSLGELHTNTLRTVARLAEVYRRQHRWADLEALVTPLLPRLEAEDGVVPNQLARLRDAAAHAAHERGRPQDALPLLQANEQAFTSGAAQDPYLQATTDLRLAKVLWSLGRRPQARAHATSAATAFQTQGETERAASAQTWLSTHR
jgi:tetratricopeptide (TPR) repeat protein